MLITPLNSLYFKIQVALKKFEDSKTIDFEFGKSQGNVKE